MLIEISMRKEHVGACVAGNHMYCYMCSVCFVHFMCSVYVLVSMCVVCACRCVCVVCVFVYV